MSSRQVRSRRASSSWSTARLGRAELCAALLLSAVAAAALAAWRPAAALVGLLPLAFTAWFFRDPTRVSRAGDGDVLAPADGLCDDLRRESACPWFAGPAVRIGIYLSLFDVHVQRAPLAARAAAIAYRPGRRVPTVRRGATDANEQCATTFAAPDGRIAVVRQIAGPLARRIVNVLRAGETVSAGQRFGLIKFGSRVELWLPDSPSLRLLVERGQRVRAGETLLAAWPAAPAELPALEPVLTNTVYGGR